jgi:hypothetical protein
LRGEESRNEHAVTIKVLKKQLGLSLALLEFRSVVLNEETAFVKELSLFESLEEVLLRLRVNLHEGLQVDRELEVSRDLLLVPDFLLLVHVLLLHEN